LNDVSLIRCESYERGKVRDALKQALDSIGGIGRFVNQDSHVLIKTNALVPSVREKRVVTDPEIVRALCEMARDAGASRIMIGDSPGFGPVNAVYKKCGLIEVLSGIPVEILEFDDLVEVKGKEFPKIAIAKAAMEADIVINVAKAKTHGQMGLTLAVKNMFGCVPGLRKSQWHLRTGTDVRMFARLLVDIASIVNPPLNILDGVIGQEGNGPSNGDPRKFNFIAASDSPFALDIVASEILGYPHNDLPTYVAAKDMGIKPFKTSDINLIGDPIQQFQITNLKRAVGRGAAMMPPSLLGFARDLATPKPVINEKKCIRCGLCAEICPIKGIKLEKEGAFEEGKRENNPPPEIDRSICIHCLCCQEICPEGAITIKEGILSRRLSRKN